MTSIHIYLNFNGNCEEAFNLYKSVFGGEFDYIGRFGEMPASDGYVVPEGDKDKIMHISLPIGSSVLMGSDTGEAYAAAFALGNNFSVSVSVDSREEADRVFAALSAGGQVTMPLSDTFWSDYFGMLTDKFGVNWMIGSSTQKQ